MLHYVVVNSIYPEISQGNPGCRRMLFFQHLQTLKM